MKVVNRNNSKFCVMNYPRKVDLFKYVISRLVEIELTQQNVDFFSPFLMFSYVL